MLSFNELEKGTRLILEDDPWEIIEASHMVKGRGQSVLQSKIKNLKNGSVVTKTFRPSENFKEAEIDKLNAIFLYCNNKGDYFFSDENNLKNRFSLNKNQVGDEVKFLKENEKVTGIIFKEEVINISLPVKVFLKVSEAPPGIKGDRAQAGTKLIELETGAELLVPLFIKQGDVIEINTEKKEYVRRV
jgi:elongation factor P